MSRHVEALHGGVWQARTGKAWLVMALLGVAGAAAHGGFGFGVARQARRGELGSGSSWHGEAGSERKGGLP